MRGRRVALLLTGLWPLLAIDDVPELDTNVTTASNSDESNHMPPPLQEETRRPILTTSNPSNVVMVDSILDTENDIILEEDYVEIVDDRIQDQHVAAAREVGSVDTPEEATAEESEPTLEDSADESDAPDEPKEASDAPAQDEPETNEATDAIDEAQVLHAADDSEAVEEGTDVETENETDSGDMPDEKETIKTEEPLDEDSAKETASEKETIKTESEESQDEDSTKETASEKETIKDESEESHDEGQAETQQPPPMDEDEDDVGTDRVLVDYASKSAGAIILEKSPAMKGTSNLLNGDNDKYAIAPCEEKKFVVINLSEDILVKQVKLANYERYSSHLKDFQIMGSQTMGDWVDLGTYSAEPGNGEQAFDLKEPAWARYLKFRFLTHHGSEHYCTYSQIKVHGSTMLQGFHEQWDSQEDLEDEGDGDALETAAQTETGEKAQATVEENSPSRNTTSKEDSASSETKDEVSEGYSEGDDTAEKAEDSAAGGSANETTAEGQDATGDNDSEGTSPESDQVAGDSSDETEQKQDSDEKSSNNEDLKNESSETGSPAGQGSHNDDQTPTLSCASIDISSHNAINAACTGTTEQLDTSSIKHVDKGFKAVVTSVVKEMVAAEALMTVNDARSVADEVKDIQETLKTTVMVPGLGKIAPKKDNDTRESVSATESVEPIAEEQLESATETSEIVTQDKSEPDASKSKDSSTETKTEEKVVDIAPSEASPNVKDDEKDSVTASPKKEDASIKSGGVEAVEPAEQTKKTGLDPTLASFVARFPSASCMEGLDYQDFKAKIIAARKERANAQGGQQGHPGKNEPIFKLLTDEIKGLQTTQSAQDHYMKALVACYQQVMLEMAETLHHVETRQEKRLLDLEKAMEASQSRLFTRAVAAIVGVVSTLLVGTRLLHTAIVTSLEALMALGPVDNATSERFVFGAFSIVLFALGYSICALRYKKQKLTPSKMKTDFGEASGKEEGATGAPNKEPCPLAVVDKPSSAKSTKSSVVPADGVHLENESDTSDSSVSVPIISLAPRSLKCADEQKREPDLVPL